MPTFILAFETVFVLLSTRTHFLEEYLNNISSTIKNYFYNDVKHVPKLNS